MIFSNFNFLSCLLKINRTKMALTASVLMVMAGTIHAQTLTDLGATAPTPGVNDVSQLSTAGNKTAPDGLNYYTDNQSYHGNGEPGQTFTTGNNSSGYTLTSLSIRTAGLGNYKGIGTNQPYYLHIYSVSGATVTPLRTNTSANITFNDGDWLQWSGLSVPLAANTAYAWSFGMASSSNFWEALAVATNNLYTGGQIGLFPPAGGTITFGSGNFDAVFDVGLAPANWPVINQIVVSPTNNVFVGTVVTFTASVLGAPPLYFQWQFNGGGGYTNIPGANTNMLVLTASITNTGSYELVLTNSYGAVTSAPVALTVTLDTNLPTVLRGYNLGTTNVELDFSKMVEAASATNLANYVFTNGLAITAVSLISNSTSVLLTTAPLVYASNYLLVVNGVRDQNLPPHTIATNTWVSFTAFVSSTNRTITVSATDTGKFFEGLGGVSGGGATSVLLMSYPEPQRSQILDLMFKPNFGAAMTTLYSEVGGDCNSTESTEPSHMHSSTDTNYQRGWEWWVINEAKKRDPSITLDAVAWGAPGWVGNGTFWSQGMCDYYVKWIQGLKSTYGYDLDAIGCRNEAGVSIPFVKMFKATLLGNGLTNVQLQAFDNWGAGKWDFVSQFASDPALAAAVDVVGAHTTWVSPWSETQIAMPDYVKTCGKPLWDTEEHFNGQTGYNQETAVVNACNANYISMGITKTVFWHLISAFYSFEGWYGYSVGTASAPWSGNYEMYPALWGFAHYNQFVKLGWQYVDGACGNFGSDDSTGTYVTLKSPSNSDFSIIIETKGATTNNTVTFNIGAGLPNTKTLCVWRSNPTAQFVRQSDITPVNGSFTITIETNSIYSISTTTGQQKGSYPIPPAKALPLPYYETYDHYTQPELWGYMPYNNIDVEGVFEITNRPDGTGKCLRQVVPQIPNSWASTWAPETMLGDMSWTDYEVSADVYFDNGGWAGVIGRMSGLNGNICQCYYLRLNPAGAWALYSTTSSGLGTSLASGSVTLTGQWHNLKLRFSGTTITGFVEGNQVCNITNSTYSHGMVGFITGDLVTYNTAMFDNLLVNTVGGAVPQPTFFAQDATPAYSIIPLPTNDAFANATVVPAGGASYQANNQSATLEPGEPKHDGDLGVAASLWWVWTPANSTNVLINTAGSVVDNVLAVYTGSSLAGLQSVAAAGSNLGLLQPAQASFYAQAGTTYYIAVASANSNSLGSLVLTIAPKAFVSGLTATVVNSQIQLQWNAFAGATGYNMKRALVSGGPYTTIASNLVTTSFTDTNVSACQTYYYVVTMITGGVESVPSLEVSAISTLSVRLSGTNMILTWPQGTLLMSTNVTGPWVTNNATSPFTVSPTNAQMFYRLQLLGNPISINFSGSGTLMGSSESAGVAAATGWNNAINNSGSGLMLNDSAGNPSGATAAWSANGVYTSSASDTAGNNRMMRTYLDTGSATTTTVTVNGLPPNSGGWNVYVYCFGDNPETREGSYTISGAGITTASVTGFNTASSVFNGTFVQASNSPGNYVLFSIPNVSGFTVSATPIANGATYPRAPVNGIQIIPR
jgi:galactosylceramidase